MSDEKKVHFEIMAVCRGGGYLYARTEPPHPRQNAKGLYPLHRVIMENKLGRLLRENEIVHHKDEDKTNNSPENLHVMDRGDHAAHHETEDDVEKCDECSPTWF